MLSVFKYEIFMVLQSKKAEDVDADLPAALPVHHTCKFMMHVLKITPDSKTVNDISVKLHTVTLASLMNCSYSLHLLTVHPNRLTG
jgi:hypothetical protein